MDKYVCTVCGWVYDPAVGDPDNGIAPGTAFEDLPDDFVCPLCGVGKDQFEKEDGPPTLSPLSNKQAEGIAELMFFIQIVFCDTLCV